MHSTATEATVKLGSASSEQHPPYDACEQCNAPLDADQRYCVACGTRRKHVRDPAAEFLASATARRRATTVSRRAARPREGRSFGLGAALAVAAIPLAIAGGVVLGRSSDGSNNKLLAALRDQKPTVVNVGGGNQSGPASSADTSTAGTPTTASALTSSFSLQSGYAVQLQTLPGHGTTTSSVSSAERAAKAKGAPAVGLISQADFTVTPAPPGGAYIIYSGQFKTRDAAVAALAKLRHAFPKASVIQVVAGAGQGTTPVVAKTAYGTAHQVVGFKPTPKQLSQGAQIVNRVSHEISNNYVQSQRGLPDSISVP